MGAREVPAWFRPAAAEDVQDDGLAGRLLVRVGIEKLVYLLDPLNADPWSVGPVAPEQVDAALRERRLRAENPCWEDVGDVVVDSDAHAERIAWLVEHGWDTVHEPLELVVDEYGGLALQEGNHRLYVLAYLELSGLMTIDLSGFIDIAEDLLGIRITTS